MKRTFIIFIILVIFFLQSCGDTTKDKDSKSSILQDAINQGYLPENLVDDYIDLQIEFINRTYFKVNNEDIHVPKLDVDFEKFELYFFSEEYDFSFQMDEDLKEINKIIVRNNHNLISGETELSSANYKVMDGFYFLTPSLNVGDEKLAIDFSFSEEVLSFGDTQLTIKDDLGVAVLNGNLGFSTYMQVRDLIENTDIRTIVLGNIPGSFNDMINVHTGRLIRANNIEIILLPNSEVYSGGVDLFASGSERVVYEGGVLGVHSWCCKDEITADKLPREDKAHHSQLEYFTQMLGDNNGEDFYFYKIKAAPFNSFHNMSLNEIKKYNLATKIVNMRNEENFISIGNFSSDKVLLLSQGGPNLHLGVLDFEYIFRKTIDLYDIEVASVHQFQTRNGNLFLEEAILFEEAKKNGNLFLNEEITFEEAKKYSSKSKDILNRVVKEYQSKGKKVYLIGASYGAFVVQDYISKYGLNDLEKAAIFIGRLNVEEEFWKAFSRGEELFFENGTNIVKGENTMGGETEFVEKNIHMVGTNLLKMLAGLVHKNYKELLKEKDLTKLTYVYSTMDKSVGSLRKDEVDFLRSKNVKVLETNLPHGETFLSKLILVFEDFFK